GAQTARANTSSVNVKFITNSSIINGGGLCITNCGGNNFAAFSFANLTVADVVAGNFGNADTLVLNVASSGIGCNLNNINATGKANLVSFVFNGGKLIIYDSECSAQNYSWLPYPFTTNNPGAAGARGTLHIVEENVLSSTDPMSPYFVDAAGLSTGT